MDVDDRLKEIEARFEQVQAEMSSPEAAADPDRMRTLGQAFAELAQIVRPYREYRRAPQDAAEARELAAAETDPEMAEAFEEEARTAGERADALRAQLEQLLVPKDPERREGPDPRDPRGRRRAGGGAVGRRPVRDVPAPRGPQTAGRPRCCRRPRPSSAGSRRS